MKKILLLITSFSFLFGVFAVPVVTLAEEAPSLIVCDGVDDPATAENEACTFNNVLDLAQAIMNFIIYISITISAGLFIWAGILYSTAGDDMSKVQRARDIFKNVAIGFIVILAAWLIVYTIVNGLTGSNNNYLKFLKK